MYVHKQWYECAGKHPYWCYLTTVFITCDLMDNSTALYMSDDGGALLSKGNYSKEYPLIIQLFETNQGLPSVNKK